MIILLEVQNTFRRLAKWLKILKNLLSYRTHSKCEMYSRMVLECQLCSGCQHELNSRTLFKLSAKWLKTVEHQPSSRIPSENETILEHVQNANCVLEHQLTSSTFFKHFSNCQRILLATKHLEYQVGSITDFKKQIESYNTFMD